MTKVYPVIFTPCEEGGYMVTVPDFPLNTQGDTMAEAIFMARDAIGLMGITLQDDGQAIPEPSALSDIQCEPGEIASLVEIDFEREGVGRKRLMLKAASKLMTKL